MNIHAGEAVRNAHAMLVVNDNLSSVSTDLRAVFLRMRGIALKFAVSQSQYQQI